MSGEILTLFEAAETERVPTGYKQTEVGVIPEDWKVASLKDCLIGSPQYGINAPAVPHNPELPTYIRITDITEDGRFATKNRVSVASDNSSAYTLLPDDLVFARTGASVGKSYLHIKDNGTPIFAGFLIRVRPDKQRVDSVFLSNYVTTVRYWSWIKTMSARSGQPGVNGEEYGQLPVPLPPLSEQRAIAAALSDVDALISSLGRLISKKRAVKTAAMQQLLTGKRRLPGFSGEWETKRIGNISRITMGRTPSRSVQSYWGRGYPWLSIADLKGKYLTATKEEITEAAVTNMSIIRKGTLVMSFKLSIGKLAFTDRDMYSNEAICAFNNLEADAEFMYYILGRTDFSLYGKQAVKGFTLNAESLNLIEVPVPTKAEQTAIATVLSDTDAEIGALEARREKTRRIKQGMMQELLTGRTRLV